MAYTPRTQANTTPYAVGNKVYGGGRSMPNIGPVDRLGYRERDAVSAARRDAVLRKLKAVQSGKTGSADAMRKV
jgi:hypothetical protein